jgi:DNA processing protein
VPGLAAQGGGRAPRLATAEEAEREMARVEALGARYLFVGQPPFPPLLTAIETAPPALIVAGDTTLLDRPTVAIVGARNASAVACRFARMIAHQLGEAGIAVVSGLARGIDTAAHMGSIDGGTVAVVAGGLDVFYPPENEDLQRRIASDGLLVSEQPPGTDPRARHFPYRNRIIAGLAQATLVVEAAPKSGSLITARLAADFGREVLAVPGSPLDVLEALRPIDARALREPPTRYRADDGAEADDAARARVTELLGPTPVAVDEVVRQAVMPSAVVQTILLELELAGRLERHAGGRVSLA